MSVTSAADLAGLKRIGWIVAETLRTMARSVMPGMKTVELDAIGAGVLRRHGAASTPQREYGFPGVTCISLNDEAVHGIPGDRRIQPGDLVKIDVEADADGYVADAARTVVVDPGPTHGFGLAFCARSAFWKALLVARAGEPIRSIGRVVENEVRRYGYSVIRELTGHGVGRKAHEPPMVPNYDEPLCRGTLTEGLVLTIEPVISAGSGRPVEGGDGWTVRTFDGGLSAHYEETIVITGDHPIVLTAAAGPGGYPAGSQR